MKKIVSLIAVVLIGMTLVGCNDEDQLNIYSRDAESGTREAFEKGIGFNSKEDELVNTAIVTSGNGDLATKVGNDINGIGYVSLSTDMAANGIKAIKFENVEATVDNVLNDSYGLKRPFMYTTRQSGDFTSDNHEALTLAFVAYLGTQDGMNVLDSVGAIVNPTSSTPTWNDIKDNHDVCSIGSTITIKMGGSTSVEKAIDAAATAFKSDCAAFNYQINQTGSGDGHKRTLGSEKDSNYADIGYASRGFKSSEDVTNAASSGRFAIDAVAVVVAENNDKISNISAEEIKKIYTGEMTTWEELEK